MSTTSRKSARGSPSATRKPTAIKVARGASPHPASQLRAQTRKLLGKHYRAKYGVR